MTWSEPGSRAREQVPLGPMTSFGLGGLARVFVPVNSSAELSRTLDRARQADLPVYVLGAGANVLVQDDGIDGVVVQLRGGEFDRVTWDGPRVVAGAGVDMAKLTLAAVRRGLAGLECMAGIPGTVGGCVRMNAGGRFGEIGSVVRRVWTVDRGGSRREWNQSEMGFRYRGCALRDEIIERVEFELTPSDSEALMRRYREIWDYKRRSQPLGADSAGCVFKNPPGAHAGELIDRAGLKGAAVGGASVSRHHANFIVTSPGARAGDVIELIELIRRCVAERFGIDLELEIDVWPRGIAAAGRPGGRAADGGADRRTAAGADMPCCAGLQPMGRGQEPHAAGEGDGLL